MSQKALYNSLRRLYVVAKMKIIAAKEARVLVEIPCETIPATDLKILFAHTNFSYDWKNTKYFVYY